MAGASADVDRLYECYLCTEIMNQPKMPPCGHSACGDCLNRLIASGVGSGFKCPVCSKCCQVPPDGFPLNFQLAHIIAQRTQEQPNQCHKCMMCGKLFVLEQMMVCHSCDDMRLCSLCFCCEHNGHEKQKLQEHMKQFEQRKPDESPHQADQLKIGPKRKDLNDQGQLLQPIEPETTTEHQELTDAMSKMSPSADVSGAEQNPTGILLIDGGSVELYSPNANTTTHLSIGGLLPRTNHVMEVLSDEKVMLVGGKIQARRNPLEGSQIINLFSKQVVAGPPMVIGRYDAASAMIGGDVYVCGGAGGAGNEMYPRNLCDKYRNGEWAQIANMTVPRMNHAVVALGGSLYAMGGRGTKADTRFLDSVERYSPGPGKPSWQPVSPLNFKRLGLAAAAHNGYIYAAGGKAVKEERNREFLVVCERYDPTSDKWEPVADMNKKRSSFSLVAFGDKLFALGGDTEKSVESYDVLKDEWKMMEGVHLQTKSQAAVAVDYQTG